MKQSLKVSLKGKDKLRYREYETSPGYTQESWKYPTFPEFLQWKSKPRVIDSPPTLLDFRSSNATSSTPELLHLLNLLHSSLLIIVSSSNIYSALPSATDSTSRFVAPPLPQHHHESSPAEQGRYQREPTPLRDPLSLALTPYPSR